MKVKTLFLLFLTLIFAFGINAQFASFRTLSTGGVIDDEIEAILGLTEMTNIEGFNIYTNLSNFTVSEPVIGGFSNNFLIGMKGSMMEMLHLGILSASTKNLYSDTINGEYREFMDTNGDQIYDYMSKSTTTQIDKNLDESGSNYFGFLFGKKEGFKGGVSYTKYFANSTGEMNFIQERMDSNIVSNDILLTSYRDYNDKSNYSYSGDVINFAAGMAMEKMEFVGAFNFGFLKNKMSYDYRDTIFNDFSPADNSNNTFRSDDYNKNGYDLNGLNLGFGIKGYFRMDEDSVEFFTGLQNNSYKPRYFFFDQYYTETTVNTGMAGDEIYTYIDSLSAGDSLSVMHFSEINWLIGGKYVKKLENALFGIGIQFSQAKTAEIDTIHYLSVYREEYDNGDGVSDVNDYTYTVTGTYDQENINNSLMTSLTIPVGLEYNFLTNLFGRIGARTTFGWGNGFQSIKYLSYSPLVGEYNYGDGSSYQVIVENPTQRNDQEIKMNNNITETLYYYGLGWTISKNVKLDFMGFSNLVDLSTWSLSVNVKFY
uniref:DUF5723 domain-containing protein n=1 Tax=candidate division WOR-3 bacterium TaxID=2052148 RepID=A0A7C3J717_UNCW3